MYQPLIKFHPHPAIFTQVLRIFEKIKKKKHYVEINIMECKWPSCLLR